MNTKVFLGFLGGVLAATGVYYVQSHRNPKIATQTVATVTPPNPLPEAPVVEAVPAKPAPKPAAPKKKVTKAALVVEQPALPTPVPPAPPAPIEPTNVEAPPAPEPPPVATVAPPPAPAELKLDPPQPRSVTITSGTLLTVRLGETVSTERNRQGDSFFAALDQPLVVDGLVIAEKGARATGRLTDVLEAGRVKGLAHLSLELTSLLLSDGQKIELRTARFEKEGPASKKEDAGKVGAGAAIGAVIGAIAGGGKGAAIGAATGGAAGGGVVAATRGKPAVLSAETKISFRVDQPVTITEKR